MLLNMAAQNSGNVIDHIKKYLPTRGELYLGCGLALYLAWVDCMFYGSKLITVDSSAFSNPVTNTVVYFVSIGTLCVTLLLCAMFHHRASQILFTDRMLVTAPLGMVLSTLLLLTISLGGGFAVAGALVAGVLSGVSSAVCLMHWGELLSCLELRSIVMSGAVGYGLSNIVAAGFQAIATIRVASAGTVATLLVVTAALMSLGAGVALAYYIRTRKPAFGKAAMMDRRKPASPSESDQFLHTTVYRIGLALILLGIVPFTCRDINLAIGGQTSGVGVYLEGAGLSIIACIYIVWAFLSSSSEHKVTFCYRLLVAFALLCVASMPCARVFGIPALGITSPLIVGSLNCLHVMMWITAIGICRTQRERTVEYFAMMRLCWALGPLAGSIFTTFATRNGASPKLLFAHMLICVAALFTVYSTVLPEQAIAEALSILPHKYRRPFKERCRGVADAYGLTDREHEVMALFAKGRDSAYIQRELNLSKSTVSTHRQHIYTKLDVHTQQELLDKLYGFEASSNTGKTPDGQTS